MANKELTMVLVVDIEGGDRPTPQTGGPSGKLQRIMNKHTAQGWAIQDITLISAIFTKEAKDKKEFNSHVKASEQPVSTTQKEVVEPESKKNSMGDKPSEPASADTETAHEGNQKTSDPEADDKDENEDEAGDPDYTIDKWDSAELIGFAKDNNIKINPNDSKPVLREKIIVEMQTRADAEEN